MKPYYKDDAVTIYHGDCREILPTLGRFDLLLTDPPYGLGDRWTGGTWGSDPMYSDAKQWDRPLDKEAMPLCIASASNQIVWGGNYFSLPPCRGFLLWVKIPAMETMADAEFAWTSYDHVAKSYTSHRNPDGKRSHPTQKPTGLMSFCIGYADSRSSVRTIIDPFMGSGTTLSAAKLDGKIAIGIELNERYCEIAANRLTQQVFEFGD
jgi:DNA modification methylase